MLIELDHNILANTDQIQTVEALPALQGSRFGRGRSRVTFADGRTIIVDHSAEAYENFLGTIIPAPPGYLAIRWHAEVGEEPYFWEQPVLAFRYSGSPFGPLAVVTDDGPVRLDSEWALIRPDGSVTDYDGGHESVDAYKAKVIEQVASAKAAA